MDMNVHKAVINNGDMFSGCTLHKVIKAVDKGRILMQKQYKLQKDETPVSLKRTDTRIRKTVYIRLY